MAQDHTATPLQGKGGSSEGPVCLSCGQEWGAVRKGTEDGPEGVAGNLRQGDLSMSTGTQWLAGEWGPPGE